MLHLARMLKDGGGIPTRSYGHPRRAMGVTRVRLLTNNPEKAQALRAAGIDLVAVESLYAPSAPSNAAYLRAKRDRLGHTLPLDLTPA